MISNIIDSIQKIAVEINEIIKHSNFDYTGTKNHTGDNQLKLDVEANAIFKNFLLEIENIKGICSEEEEEIIYKNEIGNYIIAFDPLDGSSIIDSNLSVGSIFGIYNEKLKAASIIASGYIVYGPRLEMVFAKDNVERYLYDGEKWQILGNIKLNEKGNINASGGTQQNWPLHHKILIESLFLEGYRLRYSGGMVPDLHNILIKGGGLFSYPSTKDAPNGKLRAFFEVFPFAFIFEKALGEAIDGENRLLDSEIEELHQSTKCFFGSKYEIQKVKLAYKGKENGGN